MLNYNAIEPIVRACKNIFGISLRKACCTLWRSKMCNLSLAAQAGRNQHNFSLCQVETQLWNFETLLATAKGPKTCCTIDRQYKNLFFSTCGPATISNRLFYVNTEVSLTSIQEKTDAESCTNTLAYHTKPQMMYAA